MYTRLSPAALAEQLAQRSTLSPEFWLLNPPATPKDIKRLENKLGRPIPEPLSHMLSHFNGGFASSEGKVGIDNGLEVSTARAKANRFLSCAEIDSAYRSLLRAHPDEDASEFPFIPFMRLPEGSYLAINASDPLGACWNAWTLEGPHLWQRLYPCFAAMLNDYHNSDGNIATVAHDDEPMALSAAY